jgi:perosamine synthetase
VEDAAHAAGARYRGRVVGALSPLTCFSFQAVKNMTTGEGGCVTTDSAAIARRLARLRWMGIERDTWLRTAGPVHDSHYEVAELGFNYRMHDIAAAIGLVQLGKLERLNERRREIARRYDEAFRGLTWLSCPAVATDAVSARHNYALQLDRRDALQEWLRERGIASGIHYMPLHLQPFYRAAGASLPVAERAWRRLLLLPIYPDLKEEEQEKIIDTVLAFGSTPA